MDWVDRPYLYLSIAVHGPRGTSWPPTQVNYFFDNDGTLRERKLKRFVNVHDSTSGHIWVLWKPWPVGSPPSADAVIEAAYRERDLPLPPHHSPEPSPR